MRIKSFLLLLLLGGLSSWLASCDGNDDSGVVNFYLVNGGDQGLRLVSNVCKLDSVAYEPGSCVSAFGYTTELDSVLEFRNDSIFAQVTAFPADSLSSYGRNNGRPKCGDLYSFYLRIGGASGASNGMDVNSVHWVVFTGSRRAMAKLNRQFREWGLHKRVDQNREVVRQAREENATSTPDSLQSGQQE